VNYIFKQVWVGEPPVAKFEVGYLERDDQIVALRQFDSLDQAIAFIHFLNGGMQEEARWLRALERIADRLETIARTR
jgi:hypothetical protein